MESAKNASKTTGTRISNNDFDNPQRLLALGFGSRLVSEAGGPTGRECVLLSPSLNPASFFLFQSSNAAKFNLPDSNGKRLHLINRNEYKTNVAMDECAGQSGDASGQSGSNTNQRMKHVVLENVSRSKARSR